MPVIPSFDEAWQDFASHSSICQLEEFLDKIAAGEHSYLTTVKDVDDELKTGLATLQGASNVSISCPSCKAPMRRIKGKHGYFLGCSRYKEGCKKTLKDPGEKVSHKI